MPLLGTTEQEHFDMDVEPVLETYSVEVLSICSSESSESGCRLQVAKKKLNVDEKDSSKCMVKEISMPASSSHNAKESQHQGKAAVECVL